jgi:hypothetical protein
VIGIDPHKGSHTAVAIDGNETVLDEFPGAVFIESGDPAVWLGGTVR